MKGERMFTIGRADGEPMGDYDHFGASSLNDWEMAEDWDVDEPTEYVIIEWVEAARNTRTVGLHTWCRECEEDLTPPSVDPLCATCRTRAGQGAAQ